MDIYIVNLRFGYIVPDMTYNKILAGLLISSLIFISGCTFFDNDSEDPAFLIIDNVQLSTTSLQGFPSHKIEDLWVYADGQLLGVFPLPARVAVVADGSVKSIRIAAGIRPNAVSTNSQEYPFYSPIVQDIKMDPGVTYPLDLTFTYTQTAVFDFIEAFEGVPFFTEQINGDPETAMVTTTDNVFSGTRSGLITLTASNRESEVTSSVKFSNANNRQGAVFLEMDYMTSAEVFIGVIVENFVEAAKIYKVALNPNENWNKVYVNLTDEISSPFVNNYRVVIGVRNSAGRPETKSYFDNIKLIRF